MMDVTSPLWDVLLLLWTAAAAWMDLHSRRVWWLWFILGALAAGIYRLLMWAALGFAFDELILMLIIISAAFQLWRARAWGGADAKTVMVMVIAAPDWKMLLILALADLIFLFGWSALREGWEGVRGLAARTVRSLRGEAAAAGESVPLVAILCAGFWVYWLVVK